MFAAGKLCKTISDENSFTIKNGPSKTPVITERKAWGQKTRSNMLRANPVFCSDYSVLRYGRGLPFMTLAALFYCDGSTSRRVFTSVLIPISV